MAPSLLSRTGSRIGRVNRRSLGALMERIAGPPECKPDHAHEADFVVCDQTIEDENRKLKQLVGELTLDNAALKDVVAKKW
jgi:hypothetical protein